MIEATHVIAAGGPEAPAKAILIGGLAGGVLDLGFAFTAWALKGVGPADILRSIASGLLGPAARTGFAPVPLGLVSHFLLAFLFAAAFVLIASRVAPVARPSPWVTRPLSGVARHIVQSRIGSRQEKGVRVH